MNIRYSFVPATAMLLLFAQRTSAQWVPVGDGGNNYAIAVHGNLLFAGMQGDSIYVSADQGDTWTTASTGITNASNWWLSSVGGALYCGTQGGPSFRTTDNGASWVDIGLNGARGFTEHNDTLYACTWYGPAVKWSVDQGDTWNPTATLPGSGGLWPMISHHGYLFVGGQIGGVYRIQHSSDTWTQLNTGLTTLAVYAFTVHDDVLYLGGTNGVWRSDDDGATWEATGFTGQVTYGLHSVDTRLIAAGDFSMRVSSDEGSTWSLFNAGLNSSLMSPITSDADYLYAGAYTGGGVHRRPLVENVGVDAPIIEGSRPSVFPVPAEDHVRVDWPAHQMTQYRIRSLAGTLVADGAVLDGAISVEQLSPGAYLLEIMDRSGERALMRMVRR